MMEMGIDISLVCLISSVGDREAVDQRTEPTDIQLRVLRYLINTILQQDFPNAWQDVVNMQPALQSIETNSEYLQLNAPEKWILASLAVQAGHHEGILNFFMGYSSLEGIIPRLQRGYRGETRSVSSVEAKDLESTELANVRVPVELELGQARLTLAEVKALEKGDVILLGDLDQPSLVRIAGLPKFLAVPGVYKRRLAGKIIGIWEGETDE